MQLAFEFDDEESKLRQKVMATVADVVLQAHGTLFMRYNVLEKGGLSAYSQEVTDKVIMPVLKELGHT